MVDYSKWDNLDISSSEDESAKLKRPRVRHFDEKQRVTIGPDGVCFEAENAAGGPEQKLIERASARIAAAEESADGAGTRGDKTAENRTTAQEQGIKSSDIEKRNWATSTGEQGQEDEREEALPELEEGGDLEADEAFEDAHEWPRCGPILSMPQKEDVSSEEEGDSSSVSDIGARRAAAAEEANGTKQQQQRSGFCWKGKEREAISWIRNGGVVLGKYFWTQTETEVTVDVLLPAEARGRDIICTINEDSCSCKFKGTVFFEGEFPHKVEHNEDFWLWEILHKDVDWETLNAHAQNLNVITPPSRNSSADDRNSNAADKSSSSSAENKSSSADASSGSAGENSRNYSPSSSSMGNSKKETDIPSGDTTTAGDGRSATDKAAKKAASALITAECGGAAQIKKETFFELTLRKKQEVSGTYVWWNCILKGEPCIDVSKLPGRARKAKSTRDFKEAWESAHKMFSEKIKKEERRKIEV